MSDEKASESGNGVTLLDADTIECPYDAYAWMLEEAPAYRDPSTGFYIITRYEDVRRILLDPGGFSSEGYIKQVREEVQDARATRIQKMYEEKGWVPSFALGFIDDPRHRDVREIFDKAFRPGRIKALQPFIKDTCNDLIDTFVEEGSCNIIERYAAPLPLLVTAKQTGVPLEEFDKIRTWIGAFIKRFGLMLSEEDERACVELEIEAQHYLMGIIQRLRAQPDETILSDLVNTPMSDGNTLNDNELLTHLLADIVVGGSETTTSALASGILMLCENEHWYKRLKAEPDSYLRPFVEEVLRLEAPVQGLFRVTTQAIDLHGTPIPAGAVLNIRYAAANRDPRQFECPETLDLDRKGHGSHMSFGSGIHHCVGATLARSELTYGFRALLDRLDNIRLEPGKNDLRHSPNFMLRGLESLHIEFEPSGK